jgi:hypothetical protein
VGREGRLGHRRAERAEEQRAEKEPAPGGADQKNPSWPDFPDQEQEARVGGDEVAIADESASAVPVEGNEEQKEQSDRAEGRETEPTLERAPPLQQKDQEAKKRKGQVEQNARVAAPQEIAEVLQQLPDPDRGHAEDPGPGVEGLGFHGLQTGQPFERGLDGFGFFDLHPASGHTEVRSRMPGEQNRQTGEHRHGQGDGENPGEGCAQAPLPPEDVQGRNPHDGEHRFVVDGEGKSRTRPPGGRLGVEKSGQDPIGAGPVRRSFCQRMEGQEKAPHGRGHAEDFGLKPEDINESRTQEEENERKESGESRIIEPAEIEGTPPDHHGKQKSVECDQSVGSEQSSQGCGQ